MMHHFLLQTADPSFTDSKKTYNVTDKLLKGLDPVELGFEWHEQR